VLAVVQQNNLIVVNAVLGVSTLREEHRLKVSENRALRIFGPNREEDESWGKLHNDELHSLYS
jgi:hypothetical protein